MNDDLLSRRSFLATCSALTAAFATVEASALQGAIARIAEERLQPKRRWKALATQEAADIDAITALIFPTGKTPGAHEAGVVHFVDYSIATWAQFQRDQVIRGLADLNRQAVSLWPGTSHFAALRHQQKVALLRQVEGTPFFATLRFLTIVGMFALPRYGGNTRKTGWHLIGFEDRYRWQPPFGDYDAERARDRR